MEEDDDNFLGGVIEFGDGRQYKVEPSSRPSESPPQSDSATPPNHVARSRLDETTLLKNSSSDVPVSKEERFADDFDRSWPRSRTSPALSTRDFPVSAGSLPTPARAGPATPISPVMPLSPQEASRVLFNERSNRLEPYSHAQRTGPQPSKRGPHHEMSASPTELKSARDFPPASPMHSNIQLLQKHGNADFSNRSRRFSGSSSGAIGSGYSGSYQRERDQSLRDEPPHSPRISRSNRDLPEIRGQEKDNSERGRRSVMGPPPLPPHALRRPSRDGGRQLPPHLGEASSSVASSRGQLSSTDSRFTPAGSAAPRPPSQSPVLSHTSAALISPGLSTSSLPQLSAPELDEVRKDVMQSAAARAKQRRQQEEEEREKEKERARRKAAEIEQRMKAEKVEKDNAEKVAESKVSPL
jgi:serine/arginine repetitive matrix protein 2